MSEHRGPREAAAERLLAEWRREGHRVDAVTSSALRSAAEACDLAQQAAVAGKASPLSYGRAVAVWWQVYRDARPNSAATEDPLAAFAADDD